MRAPRSGAERHHLAERAVQEIYMELFEMGAMHTVEAWKDGALVGGSFGVSIGRVWTSESMFHRAPHAGKVQFAAAAAHLIERGFEVVDGQMYSEHFARFGARDVAHRRVPRRPGSRAGQPGAFSCRRGSPRSTAGVGREGDHEERRAAESLAPSLTRTAATETREVRHWAQAPTLTATSIPRQLVPRRHRACNGRACAV